MMDFRPMHIVTECCMSHTVGCPAGLGGGRRRDAVVRMHPPPSRLRTCRAPHSIHQVHRQSTADVGQTHMVIESFMSHTKWHKITPASTTLHTADRLRPTQYSPNPGCDSTRCVRSMRMVPQDWMSRTAWRIITPASTTPQTADRL